MFGLEFVAETVVRVLLTKAVNYGVETTTNYIGKNFSGDNDYDDDYDQIVGEIIFDIIKFLNYDSKILNNDDNEVAAAFVKTKLEENNSLYKEWDLNVKFIEEIIVGIRYDVKLRRSLLDGLKNYPKIIKQKNSAIMKTICYNLKIKLDDELKDGFLFEIDIVKKIFELYKLGANTQEIFQKIYFYNEDGFGFAFEFEINQFTKIFKDI